MGIWQRTSAALPRGTPLPHLASPIEDMFRAWALSNVTVDLEKLRTWLATPSADLAAGPENTYASAPRTYAPGAGRPSVLAVLLDAPIARPFVPHYASGSIIESVRMVLAAGADPNARSFLPTRQGLSLGPVAPMEQALLLASQPLVENLLAAGADPHAKDADGYPMLATWLLSAAGCAGRQPLHADGDAKAPDTESLIQRLLDLRRPGEVMPASVPVSLLSGLPMALPEATLERLDPLIVDILAALDHPSDHAVVPDGGDLLGFLIPEFFKTGQSGAHAGMVAPTGLAGRLPLAFDALLDLVASHKDLPDYAAWRASMLGRLASPMEAMLAAVEAHAVAHAAQGSLSKPVRQEARSRRLA